MPTAPTVDYEYVPSVKKKVGHDPVAASESSQSIHRLASTGEDVESLEERVKSSK